jgi:hypothetical protein
MLANQPLVFGMWTNPDPERGVIRHFRQHAEIVIDAGTPHFADLFEMKCGMTRISRKLR